MLAKVPERAATANVTNKAKSRGDDEEGWGRAIRRAGMAWWAGGSSGGAAAEGEDERPGAGKEAGSVLSLSLDTQYFPLVEGGSSLGEASPFSAKLTNALLMKRWALLSSTVASGMKEKGSMAPSQAEAMCFMEVNDTVRGPALAFKCIYILYCSAPALCPVIEHTFPYVLPRSRA